MSAEELLAAPELDHWHHWFRSLRKFRPYLLTEPEERILTEKSVAGVSAWARLYEELLGALRSSARAKSSPSSRPCPSSTPPTATSAASAAEAVTAALEPGLRTRTSVYNTILLDKSIDDRLRGYPTWISARNLRNETTDEAVQALIDAAVVPLRRRAALLQAQGADDRPRPAGVLRSLCADR